ncbi:MAG: CopG family transcriptional regulator [Lachnospiraceae bacterium]|jgi:hypothetical protein|nr:CopG family transcriptional regulator [Lachnospiraceae bacterium]
MARMGRPKSDNPREYKITVRLTEEEYLNLKRHIAKDNLTIAQVVKQGIGDMLCKDK